MRRPYPHESRITPNHSLERSELVLVRLRESRCVRRVLWPAGAASGTVRLRSRTRLCVGSRLLRVVRPQLFLDRRALGGASAAPFSVGPRSLRPPKRPLRIHRRPLALVSGVGRTIVSQSSVQTAKPSLEFGHFDNSTNCAERGRRSWRGHSWLPGRDSSRPFSALWPESGVLTFCKCCGPVRCYVADCKSGVAGLDGEAVDHALKSLTLIFRR
jgi:hypothetical protein